MADEVIATCSVCGEPVKPYVDGYGSVLPHTASPEHWRIGYEREKARAEKAEAELDDCANGHVKLSEPHEALAAARRECEGLRKALESYDAMMRGYPSPSRDELIAMGRAALAAPAAGEEGKHG